MGRTRTFYTEKQKKRIISEFRKSGLAAREFARQENILATNINRWNKKYRNTLIRSVDGRKEPRSSLRDGTTPESRRKILDAIIDLLKYLE